MATLYRAETTLQEILGMKVGDELKLAGGDLPDYTEYDAGKALQVNQSGTGLEWGPGVPSYTSSDVGKVLTVGKGELVQTVIVPEQTVTITAETPFSTLTETDDSALQNIQVGSIAIAVINGTTYRAIGVAANDMTAYTVDELNAFFLYNSRLGGAVFGINEEEPVGGTYTVSLTATVTSGAPVWGVGSVNIIALSNRAVMDLQSTLASTITSMLSGNKDSIVSVDTAFSTNDDKEAVLAIIENGINGVISAFDFFGSKLIIPSYTVGENEGSLVLSIPFYTSVVGGTEYYLRITVKITASLPGKLDKFTHTIAVEKIDFHAK